MRKLMALLLAIVIICSLVACSSQNDDPLNNDTPTSQQQEQTQPPSNTPTGDQSSTGETDIVETIDFDASVSWANWSDASEIRDLALNRDTFALSSARHIPTYKCDTLEELNEFKATFSGIFTMDETWDEVPSFEEVTADYTEDFFAENTLLLVYVEAGSCTPRFGVDSISKENGSLCVYVKYTYNPEEGDCAMAGWLFTIPVSKNQIQDCTSFDAVLVVEDADIVKEVSDEAGTTTLDTLELSETDAYELVQIIENGEWANDVTKTISDYKLILGGRTIYYNSQTGILNEGEGSPFPVEGKSLRLTDDECTSVNDLLEKYITVADATSLTIVYKIDLQEDTYQITGSSAQELLTLLNSLNYDKGTCDGLPEYTVICPDQTKYDLNFSSGWAWIDNKECELSEDMIVALSALLSA